MTAKPLERLVFKLREVPRFVLDSLYRGFHYAEAHAAAARKSRFDTAPKQGFIIADGPHGRYVVSPRDRIISRALVSAGRFDFDKVERAFAALGEEAHDRLLVDIGANIGSICIPLVREGRVRDAIAVEPEPLNHRLLAMNVLFNNLEERIATVRAALGQSDGAELVLALSKDNLGDHRIVGADPQATSGRDTVAVPGMRLDTLLAPHRQRRLLLWIDVQGFEGAVLAGGPGTLARRPPIVMEFWPEALTRTGGYTAIRAALVAAGYATFVDLLEPQAGPVPFSPERLDELFRHYAGIGDATDILLR